MKILFEDSNYIVCVKPIGVSSQAGFDDSMTSLLEQHFRLSGDFASCYVVHRLDREVGGIMVYAKNHTAAQLLAQGFEDKTIKKEYLCVVEGVPAALKGQMEDFLFKDNDKQRSITVDSKHKGAKKASLSYEVLETIEVNGHSLSLVSVDLHTGRYHQIRAQMASRHMPIVGDLKYGSSLEAPIALWSYQITVPKVSFLSSSVNTEFPDETLFPWNLFSYHKEV